MRDFSTKIDNTAPAASGILKAAEDNVRFEELEQAVKTANISLDPANGPDTDKKMLAQAVARYASGAQWAQDQGVKNAYVLQAVGQWVIPKTLFSGMWVRWIPGATNDGASVANVFDLGNKSILDWNGAELGEGAITQNRPTEMFFSATSDAWILLPWADARNVSGDATADPGGDPATDSQLVAMGGSVIVRSPGEDLVLDPLALGAQDGDLMVVVTCGGDSSNGGGLNDTTVPAGWSVDYRQEHDTPAVGSVNREVVVASEVFSGTPPSSATWSFASDFDVAYAWFIIRNATVVQSPTRYNPSQNDAGLVSFNVERTLSQEMILVAALEGGHTTGATVEEVAQLQGLQQAAHEDSAPLNTMALMGITTAEGVSTVSYVTDQIQRYFTENIWIPIAKT